MPPKSDAKRHATAAWSLGLLLFLAILTGGASPMARAAKGKLELTVVDRDTREPIACRMHLRTAKGRPHKPRKQPSWHDHFALNGVITLELPLGEYFFELERGPEYVERSGRFTINRFADDRKEVDLRRFVDMSSHGWWSGDLDVRRPARDVELLIEADDLHVVPLTTWWNDTDQWGDDSPPESLLVQFDRNRFYHLMAGRHSRTGAALHLFNLPAPLEFDAASDEYPSPVTYIDRAREHPEAWVDLAKPFCWDLPLLVAHDSVDSIQIAHSDLRRDSVLPAQTTGKPRDTALYPGIQGGARWSQAIYFHLLNCGLRIPPSAGSGSGVAPNPVGYNRLYVHVDGDLTYAAWWESLRAGRVVVTNGPLLRPTVNGELPGHVFRGQEGQELEFEVGLTLSTREPISYMELIKNGQIEHSVRFDEYAESGRLPKLQFRQSGWFLARVVTDLGKTYRFAMTGPYYVDFGDQPRISKRSARFFLDWVYERARQIKLDDPAQHRAVIDLHRRARDFWQERLDRSNAE